VTKINDIISGTTRPTSLSPKILGPLMFICCHNDGAKNGKDIIIV